MLHLGKPSTIYISMIILAPFFGMVALGANWSIRAQRKFDANCYLVLYGGCIWLYLKRNARDEHSGSSEENRVLVPRPRTTPHGLSSTPPKCPLEY